MPSTSKPGLGGYRLSDALKLQGTSGSGPAIQNILAMDSLATVYDRLLRLEEKNANRAITFAADQVALGENANPCFRELHVESTRLGELLAQGTFFIGQLKGVRKVFTSWDTRPDAVSRSPRK